MIVIRDKGGNETQMFKHALKKMQENLDTICELTADMEDKFSERGGYSERYSSHGDYSPRGGYSSRDWEEMDERRYRDSMGRYR